MIHHLRGLTMASASTPKGSSGFTLIELLLVMVIVGILSAAYVSYSSDKKGPAVRGALNGIFGALVDARTMARGSGQTVTMTPSGTGPKAVLGYQAALSGSGSTLVSSSLTVTWGAASGQYVHASDPSVARFSLVDMDGSSTVASAAIADLKSDLQSTKVNGTDLFKSSAWTQSLFDSSKPFLFYSNGTTSTEGYVAVVGSVEGQPLTNGPVGIILVNSSGNIYRYYKSSSTSAWVRL